MEDIESVSLRPSRPVGTGGLLPSRPTIQALAVALVLIIVGLAGFVWSNGKVSTASNAKQVADAQKTQVELQAQRVQDELKKLEGSGGSQRVETIKQVLEARTDWPEIILAIGRSAPEGLSLGGFTGAAAGATPGAASSGSTTGTTGNQLSLTGTAPSTSAVNTFIRRLRQKNKVIENVELQSAQRTAESTTFSLTVTIKTPAPLPVQSTATTDPNATPPAATATPTP